MNHPVENTPSASVGSPIYSCSPGASRICGQIPADALKLVCRAPPRWIPASLAPQSPHALLESPKKKTGHRRRTTLPEITVDLFDVFIDLYVAFLWVKSFLEIDDGHLGFANVIPYAFALSLVLGSFQKFP
jgi:hypothetical protein